jgi:hypothetical protein
MLPNVAVEPPLRGINSAAATDQHRRGQIHMCVGHAGEQAIDEIGVRALPAM